MASVATSPDLDKRKARYHAGEWLRTRSARPGARWCMRALDRGVEVAGTADGRSHVAGVRRCASPWACPYCSPVIAETRAARLDQACAEWIKRGGSIVFVTATLSHKYGDDLADLLTMVQGAWSSTFRFKHRPAWYGGQVRAVEVTHGKNGWHPHVHAAIFIKPGHAAAGKRACSVLRYDWQTGVNKRGGTTAVRVAHSPGWDVRDVYDTSGISAYLTKVAEGWGLGLEIAAAYRKSGHKAGRTHAQLLAAAIKGDAQALVLYNIYERATNGRQAIVASPGLLKSLDLDDLDDANDAATAPADVVVVRVLVPAKVWNGLLRTGGAADLVHDVGVRAAGRWSGDWPWPKHWTFKDSACSAWPRQAA